MAELGFPRNLIRAYIIFLSVTTSLHREEFPTESQHTTFKAAAKNEAIMFVLRKESLGEGIHLFIQSYEISQVATVKRLDKS